MHHPSKTRVQPVPDDAAVVRAVGVALGGDAEDAGVLREADGVAQVVEARVLHELGDESRSDGAALARDDAQVVIQWVAEDAHALRRDPLGDGGEVIGRISHARGFGSPHESPAMMELISPVTMCDSPSFAAAVR